MHLFQTSQKHMQNNNIVYSNTVHTKLNRFNHHVFKHAMVTRQTQCFHCKISHPDQLIPNNHDLKIIKKIPSITNHFKHSVYSTKIISVIIPALKYVSSQ